MLKTGFFEVDSLTPHVETYLLWVVLTQAVDDRVGFMRQSLSPNNKVAWDSASLVTVGELEARTLVLSQDLQQLLKSQYRTVTV